MSVAASRIAVVGMACRVPGAANPSALWELLRSGRSGLTRLDDAVLAAAGVDVATRRDPHYVPCGGFIDGIEGVDAAFFGLPASQAELLDPQHRLFFECAWEALEDAGRMPASLDGRVGVFAGSAISAYLLFNLLPALAAGASTATLLAMTGNDKDYLPSHLAWLLGLRGPSVGVQTACSSSLAAVHLACQSLRAGECDLALAGGASVRVPHRTGYLHVDGSILSPTGACRSFDAEADGTVFSSGCGVVALRRLDDALRDGDTVLAVIAGSAINNDAQRKTGFTAPSVDGQAEVIRAALAAAGLRPGDVQQLEAHGTGTPIGDPIEVRALQEVFGRQAELALSCAKANLGHLEAAAGVAGLIAAVLALRAGERPPVAGFRTPNPLLGLQDCRISVAGDARPWPQPAGAPRRSGVSSFGIGGTNVHVVLEQAPDGGEDELVEFTLDGSDAADLPAVPVVLAVSGRCAQACEAARQALLPLLDAGADLAAISRTALLGRKAFEHRIAVAASSASQARQALAVAPCVQVPERPRLALRWPGLQGVADPAARLAHFDALRARHGVLQQAGVQAALHAGDGVGAWAAVAAAGGADWDALRAVLAAPAGAQDQALHALAAAAPADRPLALRIGGDAKGWSEALARGLHPDAPAVRITTEDATVVLSMADGPAPGDGLPQLRWDVASPLASLAALHTHGVAVAWAALLPSGPRARLPTYPFQRRRAWREPPAPRAPAPNPAPWPPGEPVDTPLAARAFRAQVTPQSPAWLGEHGVGGQVLMPAAAWLAAALAAQPGGLASLELEAPLPVPPEGVALELSVDAEGQGAIHARHARGWQRHAVFRAAPATPPAGEALDMLRARCPDQRGATALYGRMAAHGIALGPALRLLDVLYAGPGEALGRLDAGRVRHALDAPVLDALFQTLAAAVRDADAGYLPVATGAVQVAPQAAHTAPAWCHARLHPPGADGSLSGDLALLDAAGQVLLRVERLRCRSMAARAGAPDDIFQIAWQPDPLEPLPAPLPVQPPALPWAAAHLDALQALDRLCTAHVVEALPALGCTPQAGQPLAAPGVAAGLQPLVPRLLRMLREDGWLDAGNRWCEQPRIPSRQLHAQLLQAHSALAQEAALLARCGNALAAVLRGETDPVDLLFAADAAPDAAAPAADLYHGSRYLDALHALARAALAPLAAAEVPLQVLEVGGGTGSITGHVLDALGAQVAGYCFTDVSRGFLGRAARTFGARAPFTTAVFDLEQPPAAQGIATGHHHLVVAANVVHATRDLRRTLRHLRATLRPGGWLLLLEGLRPSRWLDLSFGLTEGWWLAADGLRGADGPLLDGEAWHALLQAEGFGDVQLLALDAPGSRLADQGVLLARRVPSARDEVLVCDAGLHAGDAAAAVLADLQARLPAARRALVLTRGAQAVRPWDAPEPGQAAVAGLVKAIALECPGQSLRVVDLDPLADAAARDAVIAAETGCEDAEPEAAWRDGQRWLPRLQAAAGARPPASPWRLVQQAPGLDGLVLRTAALPAPGPGEVRIAVRAAGLNFKDVLLALGALGPPPQDAPLGGECAGVVDAVGAGVTDFSPGQPVVALGGGAFASHVVVPAVRVGALPPALGFRQAAALPIAAMTALHALDDVAALAAGQTLVVHAGSGGVGHHAIALARARGARVIATAGAPAKRAYLRGLGVDAVFDSRSTGFAADVLAATGGRGADVLLNCLGGEAIAAGLSCLRAGGVFVEIGRAGIWSAAEVAARFPQVRYAVVALDRLDDAQGGALLRRVLGAAEAGALARPPLSVFAPAQAQAAYRLMQQARHIGRVVLAQPQALPLRADRSYLVSGGLGGLGLAVAGWALEQGARHLVLLSRRPPSPEAEARIAAWRAAGHDVRAVAADVADPAALAAVRTRLQAEAPPVAGIFHAAGVLADARFERQDAVRLAQVRAAKLAGAALLLAHWPALDFFVAFGSAAGLLGSAGQANHAAASAALDAWVLRQRALGVPALTLDWGAWAGIGAAARRDVGARLAGTGMREIAPARGLQALGWSLGQAGGQWAVLPVDRAELGAGGPHKVPALLRALVSPAVASAGHAPAEATTPPASAHPAAQAAAATLAGELAALPAGARLRHLAERVQAEVAAVLGGGPQALPHDRPLIDLGLDSLLAIDLRNRLSARSGQRLAATLLFDHPSIAAIARHLLALLDGEVASPAPAPLRADPPPAPAAAAPAPAAADDGDDELAALLAELERKHLG